jgi:hypothetical protein
MSQIYTTSQYPLSNFTGVGGSTTFTHGFGHLPVMVQGILVCTTGDLGYSIGDQVVIPLQSDFYTGDGVNVKITTTTAVLYGTNNLIVFALMPATGTGSRAGITNSSWSIYLNIFG